MGCRSTLNDEDPVYLCRFHKPATTNSYIYGVLTLTPYAQPECKALDLSLNEKSEPGYTTVVSSEFQVYTGELDKFSKSAPVRVADGVSGSRTIVPVLGIPVAIISMIISRFL